MMMPLVVLLWCTVVTYHNDALRRLAMVSGSRMFHLNMMKHLIVLLWCTVVAYHNDALRRLAMMYSGSISW